MNNAVNDRTSEHGGAGVKFIIIIVVLFIVANAGYNYVPVAYEGANFKQEMQTAVVQGLALPGGVKPVDNIKNRVLKAAGANNIPADMYLEVKPVGNVVQAHVIYSKPVGLLPFGIYTYTYHFDYTATPAGFLLKEK